MRGMSMLGWNKNKSDHPMADDKAAKQFLAELPTGDSFKLLEEVSFWLDATRSAEGLKPLRAYEIVEQLESAARLTSANWRRNISPAATGASGSRSCASGAARSGCAASSARPTNIA